MMSGSSRPRRGGNDTNWRAILGVAGGVLLVWFIIVNSQQVQVTWWVVDTSTSLIVVILVSALLGAGLTYFFTRVRHRSRRDDARSSGTRNGGQR
jgi:uncharacterized integral membrane protein